MIDKQELDNRIKSLKRDYRGRIEYALFKLDDKPRIAWADLLAAAHLSGDADSIASLEIMVELSLTPQRIKEIVEAHRKNR